MSVAQRRTATRWVWLVLLLALAGFEWFFLGSMTKLPRYVGPAQAGHEVPAFQTTRADGRSFTDKDLADGTKSVLVFFRGRW